MLLHIVARVVSGKRSFAVARKPKWRASCVVIGLLSTALWSCSTPAKDACTPGAERACRTDECDGIQRCNGTPVGWSSCECDSGGGVGGEGGNSGKTDGNPGAGAGGEGALAVLGSACSADEDCPSGASCLREEGEDLFGGGPPGGVCVAECSEDPERCAQFDAAVCVSTHRDGGDAPAYCFPSCAFGESAAAKCGPRANVACEALTGDESAGYCRPFCTNDEQCPGAYCDRRFGVCAASASGGGDFGGPCSPEAEDSGCSGLCVELTDDYAVCSHRCSYASTELCSSADEQPGLCALAAPGGGIGDIGYCAELCDCDADCAHPEGRCDPFQSEAVRDLVGKAGVCAPTSSGDRLECN